MVWRLEGRVDKETYGKYEELSPQTIAEPKKSIISKKLLDIILWHKWMVISVAVSITLIYLNLTEYTIGAHIGANTAATADILGALQLAIKLHELVIVASLFVIARQWVQGSLMNLNSGIVLGLLGSESSLGQPSFVISKEYLAAVSCGFSGNLRMCILAIFLFMACILSSLAGPASGVLMIPRVGWYFEKELSFPNTPDVDFPNIIIDSRLGNGTYEDFSEYTPFAPGDNKALEGGLDYWAGSYYNMLGFGGTYDSETTHTLGDSLGPMYINTSTTWDRRLDGDWNGGTTVRAVMRQSVYQALKALKDPFGNGSRIDVESEAYQTALKRWSERMYVTDGKAIEAQVKCRYRRKEPCGTAMNSSNWCYKSGINDGPMDTLRSSQDLLLLEEQDQTNVTNIPPRRVYMAEGSKMQNDSKFVTSIEVIFDGTYLADGVRAPAATQNVTVCSISATIKAVIISSLDVKFDAWYVKYLDYYQTRPDGVNVPPRKIIYHEHWLDAIHDLGSGPSPTSRINITGNVTYPQRNMSKPATNPTLFRFGKTFLNDDSDRLGHYDYSESAAVAEVAVGGAFLFVLSHMNASSSQYSVGSEVVLPDSLMPEPRQLYVQKPGYIIKVYNLGYGFRLSSRTSILGMVILIAHATIAVLGSLWQLFWERKVIKAWDTVPDYLALGLGSSVEGNGAENTCAGISEKRTLQKVVVVGETTSEHLEIILATEPLPKPVLNGTKYGCRGSGGKVKEKLE